MKNSYLGFKDLIIGKQYLIANRRSKYGTGYEQTPVIRCWNSDKKPIKEQVTLVSLVDGTTWSGNVGFKYKQL